MLNSLEFTFFYSFFILLEFFSPSVEILTSDTFLFPVDRTQVRLYNAEKQFFQSPGEEEERKLFWFGNANWRQDDMMRLIFCGSLFLHHNSFPLWLKGYHVLQLLFFRLDTSALYFGSKFAPIMPSLGTNELVTVAVQSILNYWIVLWPKFVLRFPHRSLLVELSF